ncbi:Olfactory receptor 1537 [Microtus ochrogaster]|uniref:Olfactory receptor 1537 n=1 Tax=Microtus ochrogaster TaxID=79684 RepID=A0A8J6GR34_MICOH|nr:Olfactory receptor 1537 [Microtus ochrogaster]
MEKRNHTEEAEFILTSFTGNPELQLPPLLTSLAVYLVTVVGNLDMNILAVFSSQLHTHMCYFLSSLSFTDLCKSAVITLQILESFVMKKSLSFITKVKFTSTSTPLLLLWIATCWPQWHMIPMSPSLLYNVSMSYCVCSWMVARVYGLDLTSATANLSPCIIIVVVVVVVVIIINSEIPKKNCNTTPVTDLDEEHGSRKPLHSEFFLAGLSEKPELQMPLFLLFSGIYVFTVAGNLGMMTLIVLSSHLHNPMYYFLSSLSFIDFCQSTVVTPKMLVGFLTEKNLISFPGCMTQLYFFIIFGIAECYTLAVMAYDHYVAICKPLLYTVTMSYQICSFLISGVYIFGVLSASVHIGFLIRIQFCKLDEINHYFCDILPILKLACSNTYINELLILLFGILNVFLPILTIITSYIFIIDSILSLQSTEGRFKAFSTCSSHISAVAIYFGSVAFMYLQPSSVNSMDQGKVSSMFYTTVVPMLNPLIYSLRNKDVSVALKKILQRKTFMFQK